MEAAAEAPVNEEAATIDAVAKAVDKEAAAEASAEEEAPEEAAGEASSEDFAVCEGAAEAPHLEKEDIIEGAAGPVEDAPIEAEAAAEAPVCGGDDVTETDESMVERGFSRDGLAAIELMVKQAATKGAKQQAMELYQFYNEVLTQNELFEAEDAKVAAEQAALRRRSAELLRRR